MMNDGNRRALKWQAGWQAFMPFCMPPDYPLVNGELRFVVRSSAHPCFQCPPTGQLRRVMRSGAPGATAPALAK